MARDPAINTSSTLELFSLGNFRIPRDLWSARHQRPAELLFWCEECTIPSGPQLWLGEIGGFSVHRHWQMGFHGGNGSSHTVSCWKDSKGFATFAVPLKTCKFPLKKPKQTNQKIPPKTNNNKHQTEDDKLSAGTSTITRWKWINSSRCNKSWKSHPKIPQILKKNPPQAECRYRYFKKKRHGTGQGEKRKVWDCSHFSSSIVPKKPNFQQTAVISNYDIWPDLHISQKPSILSRVFHPFSSGAVLTKFHFSFHSLSLRLCAQINISNAWMV